MNQNPVFFIFDIMKWFAAKLNEYEFWNISLLSWSLAFIMVSMVISVFWKGARG